MFKERLGIEVVPEGLEAKAFHQTVFAGDFDLAVLAYEPPFNDPFPLYLQVSNYLKEIGYTNPELESLILQSESEPGGEIRDALFEKVERMFADDLPFIPIVHRVFPRLTKPYIGGFEVGPFGESYSKDLWIKTAQKVETE
ncbi:hypothetical protein MNKW57_18570 [Biformimicrobium ophioploci]|uniref:Solute-binding protein family 5 domain-containing protein n=2 Tax=Biformimicrobium ophioploci TaxID=3036711 RepID=A0ABQ6LZM0_9GAMM|nr:hypothetical protein MNKW57_18570 [Microbulbifer sp. NKW57]